VIQKVQNTSEYCSTSRELDNGTVLVASSQAADATMASAATTTGTISHIEGTKNPADIFTKSLPGVRLRELIRVILW
jgi:hypothetical protein